MGVNLDRHDLVGVVTLDWPEDRNALVPVRMQQVVAVLERASASCRAVVLTGNGTFCSGGDLGRIARGTSATAEEHQHLLRANAQRLVRTIVDAPVPVFAAVDGPAIGLGLDVALACDDRVLGAGGYLQQGWGRLGLLHGAGGQLLLGTLRPGLIWRMLADQPRIDGPEAERLGLGWAVSGSAVDAAVAMATDIVSSVGPDALEVYVSISRAAVRAHLAAHQDAVAREQGRLLADPALVDRVAALRAPRPESTRP